MSLRRGCRTKRAQKHQNSKAYRNDLHDKSRRTKDVNSTVVSGVCQRCKEKIEWKIRYGKYKPLTAPKRCTVCHEKVVKFAYHTMCTDCSTERGVCSKCGERDEIVLDHCDLPADRAREEAPALKDMREREKRAFVRQLEKKQGCRVKDQKCLRPDQTKDSQTSGASMSDDLLGMCGASDASDILDDSDGLVPISSSDGADQFTETNEVASQRLHAGMEVDDGDNSV